MNCALPHEVEPGDERHCEEHQRHDQEIHGPPPHDPRPHQVELLLYRYGPQRPGSAVRITPEYACPVSGEQQERQGVLQRHTFVGKDVTHQRSYDEQEHEVQRPDSQDPPRIEGGDVDRSARVTFSKQQRGDEERAQRKEEIHAKSTACGQRDDQVRRRACNGRLCPERLVARHRVTEENQEEREEPQNVELWTVIAPMRAHSAGAWLPFHETLSEPGKALPYHGALK